MFRRDAIKIHFKGAGIESSIKYIDSSYTIRSVPTNPHDSASGLLLGHTAVHAGMSGRRKHGRQLLDPLDNPHSLETRTGNRHPRDCACSYDKMTPDAVSHRFPANSNSTGRAMFLGAILYRLAVGIHFLQVGGMTAQWTNENAAVARSLLLRHAFAGAYTGYGGPTAWLAPAYTFIVAAVFGVFGINSQSSGAVLLLVNTALSSLTVLVIYKLGRDYLNERVGLIAGWAWALSPLGVLMPLLLWDTSLSGFLFSLGLLALLRSTSARQWAVSGAIWGLCALASPLCWRRYRQCSLRDSGESRTACGTVSHFA